MTTKLGQESVTYLNKGQAYEMTLKSFGDLPDYRFVNCQMRIGFLERRLQCRERDLFNEWSQNNPRENILEIDYQTSFGVIQLSSASNCQNLVSFKWDTRSKEASLFFKVNCIGTEFTYKRSGGEKGASFKLQVYFPFISKYQKTNFKQVLSQYETVFDFLKSYP